jgi:hypothetical protein
MASSRPLTSMPCALHMTSSVSATALITSAVPGFGVCMIMVTSGTRHYAGRGNGFDELPSMLGNATHDSPMDFRNDRNRPRNASALTGIHRGNSLETASNGNFLKPWQTFR